MDTFSFSVVLSLRTHPFYAEGRKRAKYRWGIDKQDVKDA
jgi:hypothetical protein